MNIRTVVALLLVGLAIMFYFTQGSIPEHSTTHEKGAGDEIAGAVYDTDAAGGDLAGTFPGPTVDGLQGNSVSDATPTDAQVLKWNDGSAEWVPDFAVAVSNGAPSGADCDTDAERGKLAIDYANHRLYVCNGAIRGWDYVALTD